MSGVSITTDHRNPNGHKASAGRPLVRRPVPPTSPTFVAHLEQTLATQLDARTTKQTPPQTPSTNNGQSPFLLFPRLLVQPAGKYIRFFKKVASRRTSNGPP